MGRPSPISTKPGRKPGEFIVHVPPPWRFRLRRVLRALVDETLPDPRTPGLTDRQRQARIRARRRQMQLATTQFVSEVLTADIISKEIALTTRNRYGTRRGSLREHVQALLRDFSLRDVSGR